MTDKTQRKQGCTEPLRLIIRGEPRTKKNSARLIRAGVRALPLPSKAYTEYEQLALWQLRGKVSSPINCPVNVQCVYFMKTRRKVDLNNLLEATTDILVKRGILADDNRDIVAGHDGSRVYYDKANPRCEILITEMDGYTVWSK